MDSGMQGRVATLAKNFPAADASREGTATSPRRRGVQKDTAIRKQPQDMENSVLSRGRRGRERIGGGMELVELGGQME